MLGRTPPAINPAATIRRLRVRSVPLLLALFVTACRPGQAELPLPALPPAESLDPAVHALLAEHHARAVAAPEEAAAQGSYGLALEANGLLPEAARAFARAAALAPAEPAWRYHEAVLRLACGETAAARGALEELARAHPDEPWIRQRLGDLLLGLGEFETARPHFVRVVELAARAGEGGSEGYTGLGACELALGRPSEALKALERAIALDPSYRSAHYQLGLAYRELGRREEAERALARGLLAQPRPLPDPLTTELRRLTVGPAARLQLALQFLEAGRPERAVRILEALNKGAPEDIVVLNNLGLALQRVGELPRAQECLQDAARLAPDEPETWLNLAELALAQNTSARALEHAERALELAPDSARAHLVRGKVRARQRKFAEAAGDLEAALTLDPREHQALAELGDVRLALGTHEAAREAFRRLAEERPQDPAGALGLARVALAQAAPDEAHRQLAAARALAPEDPAVVALARELEARR